MDHSPLALAKLIIPQIPLILALMVLNRLGFSPCADKQDPQTEIVVAIIRKSLRVRKTLSEVQALGLRDAGVRGPMWIAKATCPAPSNHAREAVLRAIKELGTGDELFDLPDTVDVEAEWTGYRAGVDKKEQQPDLGSQQAHYECMMKEVSTPVTVLYFHGGAYFLLDPVFYRATTSTLAKKTGGRVFSVRYRLAPQSPFPSQLLDALIAYLYLLAPPEGSWHKPVQAKHIVFAGDSAGGHLSLSLLLLLLALRRAGVASIPFHGRDVPIQLPGGVAANSPWCDICRSLPSVTTNAKYDYIDAPTATGLPARALLHDDVWPTKPPRAEMFCRANTMTHPLCSPLLAKPSHWAGAPPVHIHTGSGEGLFDEITVVARQIYKSGAPVEYLAYEGQPHCFSLVFPTSARGRDGFTRWAKFMNSAVEGTVARTESGRVCVAKKNPLEWTTVQLETMGVDDDLVQRRTQEMRNHAMQREDERLREYNNMTERAKL